MITFNKLNNICKYYKYYLVNEASLINSDQNYIYSYQIGQYSYNLQGINYVSKAIDCVVNSQILLPDGINFATGCSDGSIKIWSSTNLTKVISFNYESYRSVYSLAILQNKFLVSAGMDGYVKILDYKTGQLIKTYYGLQYFTIRALHILKNNDIATGSWDCYTGKIWNSTSGTIKLTLNEQISFSDLPN